MTGRDRTVIAVVLVVVAIVAGWLLVIQPKRNEASQLGAQINSEQSQLSSARSTLLQNEAARGEFSNDYAELVRLGEAVPADDNVPSLIYELQSAASGAHVDFRDLVLQAGSGSATTTPAAANTAKSGSTTTSGASTSGATTTAATPTTGAAPTTAAGAAASSLPPGTTVGPAGFPTENFTLTFQGNFFNLANLLKRLEALVNVNNKDVSVGGRLITLNAINLGAAPAGFPQMDATISATTYLVPASQGLLNGATPSSPGTTSTSPVSGSSGSGPAPATISAPVVR